MKKGQNHKGAGLLRGASAFEKIKPRTKATALGTLTLPVWLSLDRQWR
jgi:hypothetical protein